MLTEVHLERRVWWLVGAATRWRRRSRGERWVVRFRLPDGSATDVVGWIEVLNPTSVRLATTDRAITVIERSMIIAARRAPAAAGGPHPRRISAREVQRHALPGWLAWHEQLGEWTLRTGGGFTRRANSCHAVGDPGMPIQQAAEQIISFAVAHDIPPLAQVIEGSPEDHALAAFGLGEHRPADGRFGEPPSRLLGGPAGRACGKDHRDAATGLGGGLSAQSAERG